MLSLAIRSRRQQLESEPQPGARDLQETGDIMYDIGYDMQTLTVNRSNWNPLLEIRAVDVEHN